MENIKIFTKTLFLITFLYSNPVQAMTHLTIEDGQRVVTSSNNHKIKTNRLKDYKVTDDSTLDEILDNVYVQMDHPPYVQMDPSPLGCCAKKPAIRRFLDSGSILFSGVSAATAGAAFKYDWLIWVTMGSAILSTCCKAASICFSEEIQKKLDSARTEVGIITQQISQGAPAAVPAQAAPDLAFGALGAPAPARAAQAPAEASPYIMGRINALNDFLNQ